MGVAGHPFLPGGNAAKGDSAAPLRPLVLLHGFMQNGHAWDDVSPLLSDAGPVCAPTLAPVDRDHATLDDLADQAHAAIRRACAQAATLAAVVVGYSMGGRVALSLARRYPLDIGLLVLESAGLGPRTEDDRAQWARRNRAWAAHIDALPTMEAVVDWWEEIPLFASQRNASAEAQKKQRRMRLSCDKQALAWTMEAAGAHTMLLESETVTLLARSPFPVHYVVGEDDAKYGRVARLLGEAGVRVHMLPGGHNVHMEHPEAFASCVKACIAQGAQASGRADGDFSGIFR